MSFKQSVRPVPEQGEAVSAYGRGRRGNSGARPACIVRVYRKGLAVRGAGQLCAKRQIGEVCGEQGQFKTEAVKQAVRGNPGGLPA